jgi:hypothetical protein
MGIVLQWARISTRSDDLAAWRRMLASIGISIIRATLTIIMALIAVEFWKGAFRNSQPTNIIDGIIGIFFTFGAVGYALMLAVIVRRFMLGYKLPPVVLRRPRWTLRVARH